MSPEISTPSQYFNSLDLDEQILAVLCISDTMLSRNEVLKQCGIDWNDLSDTGRAVIDSVFKSPKMELIELEDLGMLYQVRESTRSQIREEIYLELVLSHLESLAKQP